MPKGKGYGGSGGESGLPKGPSKTQNEKTATKTGGGEMTKENWSKPPATRKPGNSKKY